MIDEKDVQYCIGRPVCDECALGTVETILTRFGHMPFSTFKKQQLSIHVQYKTCLVLHNSVVSYIY